MSEVTRNGWTDWWWRAATRNRISSCELLVWAETRRLAGAFFTWCFLSWWLRSLAAAALWGWTWRFWCCLALLLLALAAGVEAALCPAAWWVTLAPLLGAPAWWALAAAGAFVAGAERAKRPELISTGWKSADSNQRINLSSDWWWIQKKKNKYKTTTATN